MTNSNMNTAHILFYIALAAVIIGFLLPRRFGYLKNALVFFGLTYAFGLLGFVLALIVTPFMNMRVIRFDDVFRQMNEEMERNSDPTDGEIYEGPIYYETDAEDLGGGYEEDYSSSYETERAHRLLDTEAEVVDAEFEEVE